MFLRCLQRSRAVAAMTLCSFLGMGESLCPPVTHAAQLNPFQLRSLYLYNFAKFTTWPQKAFPPGQDKFILGILGEDPFGTDIKEIKGKPVQGRDLDVEYFHNLKGIKRCQMLYICESERTSLPRILEELGNASVLTVGEWDGFIDDSSGASGMIRLKMIKDKLGFEINQRAAEAAGLKFDSRLLGLASRVITRTGERTRP